MSEIPPLTLGSLFSGIGGLEIGLARVLPIEVEWQVEINPFARRVLKKHYPLVQLHEDVCEFSPVEPVDIICGGFPCQDLSIANTTSKGGRQGLNGQKSGLWTEMLRVVDLCDPEWVVVENVASCWADWVPVVRRDLWRLGYATVPLRMCSSGFGAPHARKRVFIVAHADRDGEPTRTLDVEALSLPKNANGDRDWGTHPPTSLGMADGVPSRLHRCRAVGNAVMPDMAEAVGRYIANIIQGVEHVREPTLVGTLKGTTT